MVLNFKYSNKYLRFSKILLIFSNDYIYAKIMHKMGNLLNFLCKNNE